MIRFFVGAVVFSTLGTGLALAQQAPRDTLDRLERAAKQSPRDISALSAHAEFLDQHRDPRARQAYERLYDAASGPAKADAVRRLAILDLLAGDKAAAAKHIEDYRAAGGTDLSVPTASARPAIETGIVEIPGPLRSFNRMAALSPDLPAEELVGALARNVITNGYQATSGSESLEPTEYLKLVFRYLSQARELEKLTDDNKVLRLDNCDSPQTGSCSRSSASVCVVAAALKSCSRPSTRPAPSSPWTPASRWPTWSRPSAPTGPSPTITNHPGSRCSTPPNTGYRPAKSRRGEFVDTFISDPSLCRLYLGMSKIDPETAEQLRKTLTSRAFAPLPTSSISSAVCSASKTARPSCPGRRVPSPPGQSSSASLPTRAPTFFERVGSQRRRLDGQLLRFPLSDPRPHPATT